MKISIEQIDAPFIDLAWRLWTTLGVAGTSPQYQDCFIDLEALIILTSIIGKSDPRLLEEALDWCSKFHHFVSVSRLRRLAQELEEQTSASFSLFAETLNSVSGTKWPVFSEQSPLPIKLSGKSGSPNCKIPALLNLRLRSLFGVGAKADLITFFLTQPEKTITAADVTETGYNKRTLAETLDSLCDAGVLISSMVRNQKQYDLSKKEQLTSLAGELPSLIPDWRNIIITFISLRDVFFKHQSHSIHSIIVAIRNTFLSLKNPLQRLSIIPPSLSAETKDWDLFRKQVVEIMKDLANEKSFQKNPLIHDFEKTFSSFMQILYKIDDCIDGLETLIKCVFDDPIKHQEIFKECYQISRCYIEELQSELTDLLKFPIHYFMDAKLIDMVYRYKEEEMSSFLDFVKNNFLSKKLSLPGMAIDWYKNVETKLNPIHRFINQLKTQLKEMHIRKTNIALLVLPNKLYKRHAVFKLFSPV